MGGSQTLSRLGVPVNVRESERRKRRRDSPKGTIIRRLEKAPATR